MYSSEKKPSPVKAGKVAGYATRPPRPGDHHRWYWQIIGPGKKTLWTGWATRTEAEARAAAALLALPTEETLPSAPALPPRKATVADVLAAWIDDVCARHYTKPTTRRGAKQAAEQINRLMGGMDIETVTVVTTGKYISRRMAEGVKDRTAYGELCILRTAWRWGHKARNHGAGESFPMPPLRLSALETPRPASREDAWDVLDALSEVDAPEWAIRCYSLELVTGARPSEVWPLLVGDFDATAETLQVRGGKTGARTIYLGKGGAALVADLIGDRAPGERIVGEVAWLTVQTSAGRYIRRACKHLGIEPFPSYGLRRLAVDTNYEGAADVGGAAKNLGHTMEVGQRHYRRVNAASAQKEAARVDLGRRPTREGDAKVIPLRKSS